jgi:hypothetical protein
MEKLNIMGGKPKTIIIQTLLTLLNLSSMSKLIAMVENFTKEALKEIL